MTMEYRWLAPDEIADVVNPALAVQGFAQLNVNVEQPTCRVLGAFWGEDLVEAFALQLYPVLGPLIKTDDTFRDNGDTSRSLALMMGKFVEETKVRGALCIADSPITERLCYRFGMKRIDNPVYEYTAK